MSPDEAINDPNLLGWGNGYDSDDEAEHAVKTNDAGHVKTKDKIQSPNFKSQKPDKHDKHHGHRK